MKVTFLGCSGSGGVPMVGGEDGKGDWGACDPLETKNRRTRSSIVIETNLAKRIIIDTGPDIREQLLREQISKLDAVIYTHAHADHIAGLDELRSINRMIGKPIPIYATSETLQELENRFAYAFKPWTTAPHFFRPALDVNIVEYGDVFIVAEEKIQTFEQCHGFGKTLGIRCGSVAYCTDVMDIYQDGIDILDGVETWIVGCFQREPHPAHAWVDKVLEWREKINPERTILTHMGPDMDWTWLRNNLPQGVDVAYDGLKIVSS
ncbi:MBL fold metallo-hydrolase [Commensalibacter papalotli (ex Botero et al. 2024)]|uniref:2-cyclic phosphate phosphodiesterase (PhnP) (PDB:6B9V) n=1 Tax=Commensalibacter papalotli (ex Botero et al. 2024) TaxID=2972766 RepID=A0ABN8W1F4_9PROT|nr:MBL fold metallo-hydrolase [Commensalibacter papalotli (ex Botero et al. 2024)]CAI3922832.1 2-cyclic phosphate phosphodiesterase (PhnP) (PDB:6B9V) [Commensalibacter papalotli (ex Botero et al. 2024)]CAI3929392.1 2-cyclic phosphate phosphodiesterase (PhnP) (PDB:6B9V) [Commensalibacter papalotli (ex Botero et al. 2024)]